MLLLQNGVKMLTHSSRTRMAPIKFTKIHVAFNSSKSHMYLHLSKPFNITFSLRPSRTLMEGFSQ